MHFQSGFLHIWKKKLCGTGFTVVMEDDTNENYSALYSWYEKKSGTDCKAVGDNARHLWRSSVGESLEVTGSMEILILPETERRAIRIRLKIWRI